MHQQVPFTLARGRRSIDRRWGAPSMQPEQWQAGWPIRVSPPSPIPLPRLRHHAVRPDGAQCGDPPARAHDPQTGRFVPEKSNIWRDCVDGMYDWVKEHIAEVRRA